MSKRRRGPALGFLFSLSLLVPGFRAAGQEPLAGTERLTMEGDIASDLVAGADRFLMRETDASIERRARHWKRDLSSPENYVASVAPNRARLAKCLGVRDQRAAFDGFELSGSTTQPSLIAESRAGYQVHEVRWPAFGDVHGEGLLLAPKERPQAPVADVIAIGDADQTPEMLAGLVPGVVPESQFAKRLADGGFRVLAPVLIDRGVTHRRLSNREFLYRSAFELGRHPIGYEVQKVLAAVDQFEREAKAEGRDLKVGVFGWGEGGLIALCAAALDPRIDAACVSGYFDTRQRVWQEPIYRNVFGLLDEFGDAEIASLIVPRALIVEAARGPELVVPPGTGGGPGTLSTPEIGRVRAEIARARGLTAGLDIAGMLELVVSGEDGKGDFASEDALDAFAGALIGIAGERSPAPGPLERRRAPADPAARQRRQFHEIDRHNQHLLRISADVRRQYFAKLDRRSLAKYAETIEPYRDDFRDEVIGRFDREPLPPRPRSRMIYDEADLDGYEVVLDVFPDVFAYGILLLPKPLEDGERRPVVVCQHGLEGRPQDVADPKEDHPAYHRYAAELTRRGFITFSPQNLYIFQDRFRTLQRKANPLKKTLFSIIVPQHQAIVDWLASLPFVDPERIAFYGLSYGGKSAMRIPPLVERYCLSICSADFNEWVDKNASTLNPHSYVWTGEYEIFEFDLGSTFNYAEMAALIAPRPFMVERGHYDGVASDETVAWEFAKVRFLYAAQLKIPERCEIEWFDGPHTIHGKGTFEFLHRQLRWPAPAR
jgi:dienelactone hydrolase